MTVYVVPCGVSILDNLVTKLAKEGCPDNAKTARLVKDAADRGRGVMGRQDEKTAAWWAKDTAADAADAQLTAWSPRVLSAETNSLAASSRLGRLRELLDRRDRVLLLASNTGPGIASALSVAQHIAGIELPEVAYLTTPEGLAGSPLRLSLAPGTLTVVRLRELDPRHAHGEFIEAVARIGQVMRAAFDTGDDMEIHLTGGYKATLLHTLAMTEVLYSLADNRVRACYMFEDTAGPDAPVTPIGLRRFSQEDCDDMRAQLTGMRDNERVLPAGPSKARRGPKTVASMRSATATLLCSVNVSRPAGQDRPADDPARSSRQWHVARGGGPARHAAARFP